MGIRINSPLPEAIESVASQIVDGAIEGHRQLGPGLLEHIYCDAMTIELEHRYIRLRSCHI